jgi:hypothetical protein
LWIESIAATRSAKDINTQETAAAARVLLAGYRSDGEAGLYSRAQSALQQTVFPLHR